MKHTKLFIAILIVILFTGCQQSYHSSVTPSERMGPDRDSHAASDPGPAADLSLNTSGGTRKSDGDGDSAQPLPKKSGPGASALPAPPGNTTMAADSPEIDPAASQTDTSDTSLPEQIKIDQALELCNLAQEMWEAGRLEEALSHLDDAYSFILEIDPEQSPDFAQQKDDVRFLISKRTLEIYASRQVVVPGSHDEIPITMNDHVEKEIKRLTGPERNFFIGSLERSSRYRPYIVAQLKAAGLPEELSWLPLIESGYKLRALSSARALGLWQFIPSTGYKFGLTRNYYIDERMDFEKSTLAAIAYLKELHNLFGDWTTVLAAYNCGEGRVLRIIRSQKINYLDNFWDLYQNLPRETARYVPRFLATLHIIQNLDTYAIKAPNPLEPIPYKTVEIKKQIRLADIAKEINVSTDLLKTLNPELRYSLLPPEIYQLRIPEYKADVFLASLDKIHTTYSAPQLSVSHKIRRGETLSSIASRYKTSVTAICRANNINKAHRIITGKVIKIPNSGSGAQAAKSVQISQSSKPVKYKVKKGDSLWLIARKFSTTTKQIMAGNRLNSTTLHAGQVLTISPFQKTASGSAAVYKVRSGDSPFLIAKKHNMNLNRLLALNHLNKTSKIFPGQKLIVE
ncbi:MAG: LysM peptidoglycan-binding domain-containing protein [Desulfotignum sp.]|nr:LysM peptidoglycan-binding domain-containing protein [Desulfobacteraceae bacterium]